MLQIALCDDDIKELEHTYTLLEAYRELHPELDIALRKFQSAYDLLDAVDARGRFDIYLLDILMPSINGIALGAAIRQKDKTAVLLYLTSSPDFALESYQVEAQGYLLKPFSENALFAALDKTAERLDAEDAKRLLIHTVGGTETVPYCKLLYAEYYKHRLIAHRTDGGRVDSILYRESFDQLAAPLIADGRFVKISASHIVNMQHIQNITSRQLVLANGEKLALTRVYAAARQTFIDYILEKGLGG